MSPPPRAPLLLLALCGLLGCADYFRYEVPTPRVSYDVRLPVPGRVTLPGGMQLWLLTEPQLPLVHVGVALANAAEAPPGAELLLRWLVEGDPALREQLDALGAQLGLSDFSDGQLLWLQVHSAEAEAAVALLGRLLRQLPPEGPAFQTFAAAHQDPRRLESPRIRGLSALRQQLFPVGHPYHPRADGQPLRYAALRAYHAQVVNTGHLRLLASGRVGAAGLHQWALQHFAGQLPQAAPALPSLPPPPPRARALSLTALAVPGLSQTEILVGAVTVPSGHPAEPALDIAATWLHAAVHTALRSDRGQTYAVVAGHPTARLTGYLALSTAVAAQHTGSALRSVLEAFEELPRFGEGDLYRQESARRRLPSLWQMHLLAKIGQGEALAQKTRFLGGLALWGGPVDRQQRELQGYEDLDPAALRDVARRYLRAEQLRVVLVGDPQLIAQQVAPLRLGAITWLPPVPRL